MKQAILNTYECQINKANSWMLSIQQLSSILKLAFNIRHFLGLRSFSYVNLHTPAGCLTDKQSTKSQTC